MDFVDKAVVDFFPETVTVTVDTVVIGAAVVVLVMTIVVPGATIVEVVLTVVVEVVMERQEQAVEIAEEAKAVR